MESFAPLSWITIDFDGCIYIPTHAETETG
jgi:hypothetical protein